MENMEARFAALEQRLTSLEDRAAIENLMAKHNYYFSAGQGERIVPELWSADENATLEYGASGVYKADKDSWKIKTFYVKPKIPGRLTTFTAANQWIKVAPDGNSAEGVWMVVGTDTDACALSTGAPAADDQRYVLCSSQTPDGKAYRAEVLYQKHAVRFVKEDGAWKIHDLHVMEYFRAPAGSDWVAYAKTRQDTDGMWLEDMFESLDEIYPRWGTMRAENLPSGSSTCHWQYDVDAIPTLDLKLED